MAIRIHLATYGCQMNVSDSELAVAILRLHGYEMVEEATEADLVLLNTCAIRDNAEQRIHALVRNLVGQKRGQRVGILGCMAARLKESLLNPEQGVVLVAGPDSYRRLPAMVEAAMGGESRVDVVKAHEETYEDLVPYHLLHPGVGAFTTIMRGCDNCCSYCVVPFTRGRERSRAPESILGEIGQIARDGFSEVTLLGQNVDSYRYEGASGSLDFAGLLGRVAETFPTLRVRFATSHPKDLSNRVCHTIAAHPNICNHIHLPVQSGSTVILERMRRGYSREDYLAQVDMIRTIIPGCAISTDIIAGFCGETATDHEATLSLMREVRFDAAYMFKYSERPGTLAARTMPDDVPEEVKGERLREIIDLQNEHSEQRNREQEGLLQEVLVEGPSKRDASQPCGRTEGNRMVIIENAPTPLAAGKRIGVRITRSNSATLWGTPETSSLNG